jgi:hypothetical protein
VVIRRARVVPGIRLDPEAMKVAARLGARTMDDVLLAAGDEP